MPLVSMKSMLADALAGGYAVCYCESWNLESFQAVIDAASDADAPVIAGFSGGFLADPDRKRPERLSYYAGLRLALAGASVPVSFLLNESDSLPQIEEAIDLGFNAVMIENEHLDPDAYRRLVKKTVARARPSGVSVEAQLGTLPHGCDLGAGQGEVTDPRAAREFVEDTGIDALGVSVGNIHILTSGESPLHLDRLESIHAEVDVPLVLHGGTGIPPEYAAQVICRGVAKINFGTVLKQVFLAAVREKLEAYQEPMNPHPFVGMGGPQDVLVAGREAMMAQVRKLLHRFGAAGRAGGLACAGTAPTREVNE